MDATEFQAASVATMNQQTRDLQPWEYQLLNASAGLAGESGEFLDLVKKIVFHDKPVNLTKVIEELGDVQFYMAFICHTLRLDLSDIMARNVEKLKKRYPNGFNPADSQKRMDEKETEQCQA